MIPPRFKIICVASVLVLASNRAVADAGVVLSPAKRQESLEKSRKLLATRDVAPITVDPFHSERFSEMIAGPRPVAAAGVAPVAAALRTDRDILQAIAASLKPSGNFNLGGQQTLVFGQKRVKAGGQLTITFEGTEYILEITAIERTSFTLRLNREEFTRPIK